MRIFFRSVGLLLVLAGAAKLQAATGEARILGDYDPLFHFQLRLMLSTVGLIELLVAWGLFSDAIAPSKKAALTLWLSGCFGAYHIGLREIGFHGYCACLGNIFATIGISNNVASKIVCAIVLYMLTGSILMLLLMWRRQENGCGGQGYFASSSGNVTDEVVMEYIAGRAKDRLMTERGQRLGWNQRAAHPHAGRPCGLTPSLPENPEPPTRISANGED